MIQKLLEQEDPRILGNGDIFDSYKYWGAVQKLQSLYGW